MALIVTFCFSVDDEEAPVVAADVVPDAEEAAVPAVVVDDVLPPHPASAPAAITPAAREAAVRLSICFMLFSSFNTFIRNNVRMNLVA
jgi:hypothetical protein